VLWAGLALMIASFALYPGYLLVAVLPITRLAKVEVDLALWLLSWCSFSVGSAMAGAKGVEYLERRWQRRSGSG